MFGSSLITKGKGMVFSKYGSEAERILAPYLFDDAIKMMSSFEMNKIASLTYGEQCCEDVFDLLAKTLAKSTESTVLALLKTLVLVKHLVIYGSEESVENAFGTGHLVQRLLNFNTVLHGGKANNFFLQIKGGSVDQGLPIRNAAKELFDILSNKQRIYDLRAKNADPNSLVPVGDKDDIAFQTSDLAKKNIARQKQTKSNLAKQRNGFGSGYNPRDSSGRMIVGAAHSIEEMMAAASKEKTRYCDDVNDPQYLRKQEQLRREKEQQERILKEKQAAPVLDLLDFDSSSVAQQSSAFSHPPPTNNVFDIFDTPSPAQPILAIETQENLELKLKAQQAELDRLKREMEEQNTQNFSNINNNMTGINNILDLTQSVNGSAEMSAKKNIMTSSSSVNAISALDALSPMPIETTYNLPSTFESLSIKSNPAKPPSDDPPPLPSSPPPPPPSLPPPEPLSLSSGHDQDVNSANAFGSVVANNFYQDTYSVSEQSLNVGTTLGSAPMGGSSAVHPITASDDILGTKNTIPFEQANLNQQPQNQNAMDSSMSQVNMMMNPMQTQQNNGFIQNGMMNPMMAQMQMQMQMLNSGMMTPEQQQLFLQQQQLMMMSMMNQKNTNDNSNNTHFNGGQTGSPGATNNIFGNL